MTVAYVCYYECLSHNFTRKKKKVTPAVITQEKQQCFCKNTRIATTAIIATLKSYNIYCSNTIIATAPRRSTQEKQQRLLNQNRKSTDLLENLQCRQLLQLLYK